MSESTEEYIQGLQNRARQFGAERGVYFKERRTMKYQLSKFIPMFFRTTYRTLNPERSHDATWWQWRGRVYQHREVVT